MLYLVVFFLISCNRQPTVTESQQLFFSHFKQFEGKKFNGTQTYIAEGLDSWENLELVMHVKQCTDSVVYIPFRVGENTSRTWMIMLEAGEKLRFRHDHRHSDGTPEDVNLYGGYASDAGNEFKQNFPADDFTCKMLERICDNVWVAEFTEDFSGFTYSLRKADKHMISIYFDLTQPID